MTSENRIAAKTGLYAIVDVDAWRACGVELAGDGVVEAVTRALAEASPFALQLRAKHEGGRATLALLRRMRAVVEAGTVPLFANDRPDLALLARADGVHVGQDDLPLEDVRRVAPGLAVGISTHRADQLEAAISSRPSYLAYGPVFGTSSKLNPDPVVGLDGFASAARKASDAGLPLVAIGGVTLARAPELVRAGARIAAAISELVVVRDGRPDVEAITRRARELHAALGGA